MPVQGISSDIRNSAHQTDQALFCDRPGARTDLTADAKAEEPARHVAAAITRIGSVPAVIERDRWLLSSKAVRSNQSSKA